MAGRRAGHSIRIHFQRGDESFLGDFYLAELAHFLFALFLFVEELSLAGDVATVTLGRHVFAQRLDRLARNDAAADRRLDGLAARGPAPLPPGRVLQL
jgi:hypothetical protein